MASAALPQHEKDNDRQLYLMVKYGQRWRLKTIGRSELRTELRNLSPRHEGMRQTASGRRLSMLEQTHESMSLTEKILLNQAVQSALKRTEVTSLRKPIAAFQHLQARQDVLNITRLRYLGPWVTL